MDAILQVDNLTKQYADFKLDHVSFSVPKGTIMGPEKARLSTPFSI